MKNDQLASICHSESPLFFMKNVLNVESWKSGNDPSAFSSFPAFHINPSESL